MANDEKGKPKKQSTGIIPGSAKRTVSSLSEKLMAYIAVQPFEFPGDPEALPYVKKLLEIEDDYTFDWNKADNGADALESQVRRRRDELIQIICHDYPETAEKLLLHGLPAPKVEANGDAPSKSPELTRKLERGARCARILDEVKEFKHLRVDAGMTVAEIQEKNPGFVVWKLRENLTAEDRDYFDHPNRWESVAGYAYGLLGKEYAKSWTTVRDWVKAWNSYQKEASNTNERA